MEHTEFFKNKSVCVQEKKHRLAIQKEGEGTPHKNDRGAGQTGAEAMCDVDDGPYQRFYRLRSVDLCSV